MTSDLELCETCDNNKDNCTCVDCKSCGKSMQIEDAFQGKCGACEDKQMVQGIQ